MLPWGMHDYWVGVLVDGEKYMVVIQAMNENEAEQYALLRFKTGKIYYCELAKGF